MPMENERKFVLYCDRTIIDQIRRQASNITRHEQAFLKGGTDWSVYIRKSDLVYKSYKATDGSVIRMYLDDASSGLLSHNSQYTLTYKQKVNSKQVEIETNISQQDYQGLFKTCMNYVYKNRYTIKDEFHLWEFDEYVENFNSKKPYFILAEVKLPEDLDEPKSIPEVVKSNLVYMLDKNENGFSSKELCDSKHAERKYKQLLGIDRS